MKATNRFLFASLLALAVTSPVWADDPAADPAAPPAADESTAEEILEEAEPNPLYDLFYEVDDLLSAEKKDEATEKILGAMDDVKYAKYKADLATVIVRFLLFTEQVPKAKEFFLETIRTTPELARPGFEILYSYYINSGDTENAIAWAKELLEQPLQDDQRQMAVGWLLTGLLVGDKEDEFFAELARLDTLDPSVACGVAEELCRTTYHRDRFDLLLREIDVFTKAPYGAEPSLRQTILSYGLLAKAGKGDWAGVKADFPEVLSSLEARPLRDTLNFLFARARQQKAVEAQNDLADAVLHSDACKDNTVVRNIAAREWVAVGVDQDKTSLPARAAALRALGIPAQTILSAISRHFYDVLDEKDTLKALIAEMDALRPLLDEDARRNTLDSLMLDAAFVTEDFERVLAIIDAGVPDRDEAWHTMTRTKVLAHIALQKGEIDEAIKQFRAFMDIIANTTEVTPDPTSGVVYTPEAILGINAKRIGDIYKKAGRADEAKAAYAEAKGHYEKALQRAKGTEEERGLGSETVEAIEQALKDL